MAEPCVRRPRCRSALTDRWPGPGAGINDLALIAGGFYRLGRESIHESRAHEALRLWQFGQIVAQDSGNLSAVAVLHTHEAWAYAIGHCPSALSELPQPVE